MFNFSKVLSSISIADHLSAGQAAAAAMVVTYSGRCDTRTGAEQFDDWTYGMAAEAAVIDRLKQTLPNSGWEIKPPTSKTHDFILTYQGRDILVDVKTVRPGARSLTVSKWETTFAEMRVVYLVFELDRSLAEARLLGATARYDLSPSKFAGGSSFKMISGLTTGSAVNDLIYRS